MMIVTDTKTGTLVLSQSDHAGQEHIVLGSLDEVYMTPRMVMDAAAELLPFSPAVLDIN